MLLDSLIDALQESLDQANNLILSLSSEQYCAPAEGHFQSSVGIHIRHSLDHLEAFFRGLDLGRVDYESRSRESKLEDTPGLAEEALNSYRKQLNALRVEGDRYLRVREESEASIKERRWLDSSLRRELQFLLSHTVHHNAIIAMVVDRHGIQLPEGFGVASSTRRHIARSGVAEG